MTAPTFEQLERRFIEAKFRQQKESRTFEPGTLSLFYRRIRTGHDPAAPVCLQNDRLSFHATVYEMKIPGHETPYRTVMFDITGEYREGCWTKLSVYSVSWAEAIEQLERIQRELLVAWDALCTTSRPTSQGMP